MTLAGFLLLHFIVASSFRIANLQHNTVDEEGTEGKLFIRQGDVRTTSSSTISTLGILPPLGTGVPLTGHGPAIQPQPDAVNAGAGTGNDTTTNVTGNVSGAGPGNNTDTGTSPYANYTELSNSNNVPNPGYLNKHLEVSEYQYTKNGRPRVEIQVKYGSHHVTQTWEVRNGTLHQVHPKSSKPCRSSSTYMPEGTGMPPRQERPSMARPGFTGP